MTVDRILEMVVTCRLTRKSKRNTCTLILKKQLVKQTMSREGSDSDSYLSEVKKTVNCCNDKVMGL